MAHTTPTTSSSSSRCSTWHLQALLHTVLFSHINIQDIQGAITIIATPPIDELTQKLVRWSS
jgi:hypothetical protein